MNTVILAFHKSKVSDIGNASSTEDLHKIFKELNPLLKGTIDSIEDLRKMYFAEMFSVKTRKWYNKRVVLAGDSKHARSPVSGMGTTLAIEDAYVLANEIIKNESIEEALRQYERQRQIRASFLIRLVDALESKIMRKNKLYSIVANIMFRLVPNRFFIYLLKKVFKYSV